jgi:hypothetical protein
VRVLVLTSTPISAGRLREVLRRRDGSPVELDEVMVIAPALHESALRFWVSDADEAIARAQRVARESVAQLDRAAPSVDGGVGEGDFVTAIEDALAEFPADEVIIFSRGGSEEEHRYREDVDRDSVRERLPVPVRFAKA